ncbi:MAG: hypothetical protein GY757_33815 [bacterium]|nr:hypothetical protein [bacterium]
MKDPLKLLALELKSGQWIKSEDLPFDSEYREWDFSFDRKGNRFLFTSTRPAYLNGTLAKNSNIWFTEYSDSKWTKPRLMRFPVNSVDSFSGYPSVTKKGVIYFHSRRGDSLGSTDIYAATLLKDGNYELKNSGAPVNSKYKDLDPAISPDGSYLIFVSYKPSEYFTDGDMYVSFLTAGNTWSVPQALGGILGAGGHPCISQDGKYLFYTCEKRGTPDIYWIDLKAVTGLKPKQ